jgi:hypothetical protein
MRTSFKTLATIATLLAGTAGIAAAQDGRHYDRDDYGYQSRPYDDDDYRYENRSYDRYENRDFGSDNFRQGMHEAREFGARDGSSVARQDLWSRKPFNPNPRGRFDDADHGYRREFGSLHEYREHYTEAYRQAYERSFRRNDRY